MFQRRRRFKQATSLKERLVSEVRRLREEAKTLPHGPERERALRRGKEAEFAAYIDDWLASPALRPPTRTQATRRFANPVSSGALTAVSSGSG